MSLLFAEKHISSNTVLIVSVLIFAFPWRVLIITSSICSYQMMMCMQGSYFIAQREAQVAVATSLRILGIDNSVIQHVDASLRGLQCFQQGSVHPPSSSPPSDLGSRTFGVSAYQNPSSSDVTKFFDMGMSDLDNIYSFPDPQWLPPLSSEILVCRLHMSLASTASR